MTTLILLVAIYAAARLLVDAHTHREAPPIVVLCMVSVLAIALLVYRALTDGVQFLL